MVIDSGGVGPHDDSHAMQPSDDRLTADLLHAISRGQINPSDITADRRRDCVEALAEQGFSIGESARLLRVSERTIKRDRAANRAEGSMQPSVSLGDELMGQLQATILASNQRLTRLATNDETPPYVKVWAENTIVRNCTTLVDKARELGYYRDAEDRLDEITEQDPGHQRRAAKAEAKHRAIEDEFNETFEGQYLRLSRNAMILNSLHDAGVGWDRLKQALVELSEERGAEEDEAQERERESASSVADGSSDDACASDEQAQPPGAM